MTRTSNRASTKASTERSNTKREAVKAKKTESKKKVAEAPVVVTNKQNESPARKKAPPKNVSEATVITTADTSKKVAAKANSSSSSDVIVVSIEASIEKAVGKKAVVEINKEKPGKGNFIVRVTGIDTPIIELIGLKRPFPSLKALDMNEISLNVLNAIGSVTTKSITTAK